MVGLIMIGLARCIAMVIVWNDLAEGDSEYCGRAGGLQLDLPGAVLLRLCLRLHHRAAAVVRACRESTVDITIGEIAESVFIYLGIPFLAGMITRFVAAQAQGQGVVRDEVHPADQPDHADRAAVHDRRDVLAQGRVHRPAAARRGAHRHAAADLLRGHVPGLVLHGPQGRARTIRKTATLSFTAASNNFELAIAVAVAVFGIDSGAAFAAVIGPLVEVPVLIGLVNVALYFKRRYFRTAP